MQVDGKTWLISGVILGIVVLTVVVITVVVVLRTKKDGGDDREKETGKKESPPLPPPKFDGLFPDYQAFAADLEGDALLEEILSRGLGFDVWQLRTDAQRQLVLDQNPEALPNTENDDEETKNVKKMKVARAQLQLELRQTCMQVLEQSKLQPPLPGASPEDRELAQSALDDLQQCYRSLGTLGLSIEPFAERLREWGTARHALFLLPAFVDEVFELDTVRLTPSFLRHLEAMYSTAKQEVLFADTSASTKFFTSVQHRMPLIAFLFFSSSDDESFECFFGRFLRLVVLHKALMAVAKDDTYSLAELPVGLANALPHAWLIERFVLKLPTEDKVSEELDVEERWKKAWRQLDMPSLLQDYATVISDNVHRVFSRVTQGYWAMGARLALSFLAPDYERNFAYSPTMQQLRDWSQVEDPTQMLSAVVSPRPVRNSHAICYGIAIFQCLANLLPLFEQHLSKSVSKYHCSVSNVDTPKTWQRLQILRDLNTVSAQSFNDDGTRLAWFRSGGNEGISLIQILGMWDNQAENCMPGHRVLEDDTAAKMSAATTGPLLIINRKHLPAGTEFAAKLADIGDGWTYQGANRPLRRCMHLRAVAVGGHGHATAYVQRRDGTWWHCDDALVEPVAGPPLRVGAGYNYLCFYLEGPC
jgi:hypothetical protein